LQRHPAKARPLALALGAVAFWGIQFALNALPNYLRRRLPTVEATPIAPRHSGAMLCTVRWVKSCFIGTASWFRVPNYFRGRTRSAFGAKIVDEKARRRLLFN